MYIDIITVKVKKKNTLLFNLYNLNICNKNIYNYNIILNKYIIIIDFKLNDMKINTFIELLQCIPKLVTNDHIFF